MQLDIKDIASFIANGLCVQMKKSNNCDLFYIEASEETKSIFIDYFLDDLYEKSGKTQSGKCVVYGFNYDEDRFCFFNEDNELDKTAREMVKYNMSNVLEHLPKLEEDIEYNLPPTLIAFEPREIERNKYNYKFVDYTGWVIEEIIEFMNELYS